MWRALPWLFVFGVARALATAAARDLRTTESRAELWIIAVCVVILGAVLFALAGVLVIWLGWPARSWFTWHGVPLW